MTREEAIKAIDHLMYSSPHESTEQIVKKKYYAELLKEYIVNTVDVVRCRECIHLQKNGECYKIHLWIGNKEDGGCDDFFCGYGERKTEWVD